jgi:hypothetical protein
MSAPLIAVMVFLFCLDGRSIFPLFFGFGPCCLGVFVRLGHSYIGFSLFFSLINRIIVLLLIKGKAKLFPHLKNNKL